MYDADRPGLEKAETQRLKEEKLETILAMVRAEVLRAMAKHPPMHSPHEGHSVIREEFEELWDHVKADTGTSIDATKEAVQIGCTAVRYVLDLCRV